MQPIDPQYGLQTWVAPTENIRLFVLDLQPICAEYEPETLLALSDEIRVKELDN